MLCLRGRESASSCVKSSRGPFSLHHEKPQLQPLVHKWKPPHSPSDEQPYGAGPLPRPFRRPALLLAGWAEPGKLVLLSRPPISSSAKQSSALAGRPVLPRLACRTALPQLLSGSVFPPSHARPVDILGSGPPPRKHGLKLLQLSACDSQGWLPGFKPSVSHSLALDIFLPQGEVLLRLLTPWHLKITRELPWQFSCQEPAFQSRCPGWNGPRVDGGKGHDDELTTAPVSPALWDIQNLLPARSCAGHFRLETVADLAPPSRM